jgi:hypothetical protein
MGKVSSVWKSIRILLLASLLAVITVPLVNILLWRQVLNPPDAPLIALFYAVSFYAWTALRSKA